MGVGTKIKQLLAGFRIAAEGGCGCQEYADDLDARGVAWCEEHAEEIVAHLVAQAQKRRYPLSTLFGGLAAKLAARRILRWAIAEAKADASRSRP